MPSLNVIAKPVKSTGVFASTVTEFIAVVMVDKPVTWKDTSITAVGDVSDIVNKLVVKLTLAVPTIGPMVPGVAVKSIPETSTVKAVKASPTDAEAVTPDGVTNAVPVLLIVPTEVSRVFSPCNITAVASATIEYGPIFVVKL